jgi:hypothetical protein
MKLLNFDVSSSSAEKVSLFDQPTIVFGSQFLGHILIFLGNLAYSPNSNRRDWISCQIIDSRPVLKQLLANQNQGQSLPSRELGWIT